MASSMHFDLVSPEAALASMTVSSVEIPGSEGDFTAMPDHAPVITTLRPGVIKASSTEGSFEYVVSGGFVEVNSDSTSILAEQAFEKSKVSRDIIESLIADAEKFLANAGTESKDSACLLYTSPSPRD